MADPAERWFLHPSQGEADSVTQYACQLPHNGLCIAPFDSPNANQLLCAAIQWANLPQLPPLPLFCALKRWSLQKLPKALHGMYSVLCSKHVIDVQDSYLTYFLTELAGTTAMIFTRTCDNTRRLALMLRNLGFDALPIHGQMSQPKRLGALNKFKGGDRSILVATGVSTSLPSPY